MDVGEERILKGLWINQIFLQFFSSPPPSFCIKCSTVLKRLYSSVVMGVVSSVNFSVQSLKSSLLSTIVVCLS